MAISISCLLQEAEEILQNMMLEELAEDVAETETGKILVLGGWWVEIPKICKWQTVAKIVTYGHLNVRLSGSIV